MTYDIPNVELLNPKEGGDITYMDMVEEKESMGESQIQKMFAGSSVFLTGGTGFLGKLLSEKLLRSCPDIKKLYMLARPKKNKDTTKRIQEQFDDVLYDKLRKERPNFIQKIVVVEGDVGQIGLGMNEQDRLKVMNDVEFIFHGAATVRFDEPLKTAVEINVRGTREIFQLARACGKLKAVVHISTAYSNCALNTIDEKFYTSIMPGDKLIDLVETMDEKIINNITPGLLGDFPNTYAYTKSVAENIIMEYSKGLPVAVFRPAIVIATVKEPVTGWIDNVYGPTGVVVGAAIGLLHALHCDPKAIADLVPGDMVVNACIATAWKTAKEYPGNHEDAPPQDLPPPVYNYVSSEQNPLTWEKFMSYTETNGLDVPPSQAVYYYLFKLTASRWLYTMYCFFLHWLPAYIIDGIAMLIGKKPMLRKAYTKISKFSEVLAYFALKQWKFYNRNTQNLFSELCDADKRLFDFDMSNLNWNDYFYSYVRGIRVYLLKDPLDTVPKSVTKHTRLRYLHYTFCCLLSLGVLRLLWGVLSYMFSLVL
ncbi:fatty acyl-CoA reductase wat-like [Ostrinia furnacalis]|uniref:fatty acyl-CoA reductase wat-like n=1 Tax=Ostrinia furnacalis TaxID=93504 RepID=UPI00103DF0C3|nr:fatty acyl-CoA reductase wat-like [Ostrinia furnacalis]